MAHCVRQVSFLVAAASMRRPLIGDLARACRSIPVERPQDVAVTVRVAPLCPRTHARAHVSLVGPVVLTSCL
jgi:1-acyl-sn-glycerol-3-phosphate acyltransferase